MLLRIPKYYTQFQCIADKCSDSCCAGWEINIDEDTYDYYQQIPGEFGKRLRRNTSEDKERKFILQNHRCPFLNKKNLCDICIELGEEALCETCTEYPRSIMEYGNVREKCLSLSCEEAGRLIFESKEKCELVEIEMPDEYGMMYTCEMADESDRMDAGEMADENVIPEELAECAATVESDCVESDFYESIRNQAIAIVQSRELPILYRIEQLISFGQQVQALIDAGAEQSLSSVIKEYQPSELLHKFQISEESMKAYQEKMPDREKLQDFVMRRLQIFRQMEVLDEEWGTTIKSVIELFGEDEFSIERYIAYHKEFTAYYHDREYEYEHLMVYFLFRYGMMAIYDHDILSKIKFSVLSFLMIRDIDVNCFIRQGHQFTQRNRVDMARIYSKQVEHAQDMLDYLEEKLRKTSFEWIMC